MTPNRLRQDYCADGAELVPLNLGQSLASRGDQLRLQADGGDLAVAPSRFPAPSRISPRRRNAALFYAAQIDQQAADRLISMRSPFRMLAPVTARIRTRKGRVSAFNEVPGGQMRCAV